MSKYNKAVSAKQEYQRVKNHLKRTETLEEAMSDDIAKKYIQQAIASLTVEIRAIALRVAKQQAKYAIMEAKVEAKEVLKESEELD